MLYSLGHMGQPHPMCKTTQTHESQMKWGSWGQAILESGHHSPPSNPQSWARCCKGTRLGSPMEGGGCVLYTKEYELLWPWSSLRQSILQKWPHLYIYPILHALLMTGWHDTRPRFSSFDLVQVEVDCPNQWTRRSGQSDIITFLRLGHSKGTASA